MPSRMASRNATPDGFTADDRSIPSQAVRSHHAHDRGSSGRVAFDDSSRSPALRMMLRDRPCS
jgi:hypothetical protein